MFGGGVVEQSCLVCKRNPERRAAWGCDAPAPQPTLSIDCPFCERRFDDCPHCNGKGSIDFDRCPFALTSQRHFDVCQAAVFAEVGLLPGTGGWAEQGCTFLDALCIVLREKAEYERIAAKQAQRRAQREQRR